MTRATLKLTEAQRLMFDHVVANKKSMLFVGMGLGKTAALLTAIRHLLEEGEIRGALVIAPLRVANVTWPLERDKWSNFTPLNVVNTRYADGWSALLRQKGHIFLINYEALPRMADFLRYAIPRDQCPFDMVVWDEITRAKNHASKRVNAVRKMLNLACERRVGLTGTPAPNGLMDLFAQYRVIDDGLRLGQFITRYRDEFFYKPNPYGYDWLPRQGAAQEIERRVKDITLTLSSEDWLNIPDTAVEEHRCSMPGPAREFYDEMKTELIVQIKGQEVLAPSAGVLVNKLAQMAGGAVYDENRGVIPVHDEKIKLLKRIVDMNKSERFLICYTFQHELARIRKALGWECAAFSDAKSAKQQTELVENWNAKRIRCLAAHPASLGHGLNMQQGGRSIVFYSYPWSPEQYDQTVARLARMGQGQVTRVFHLVTADTMDDVILSVLQEKKHEEKSMLNALKLYFNIL